MHWRAPIDKGSGNYIYIDTFNVIITIIWLSRVSSRVVLVSSRFLNGDADGL